MKRVEKEITNPSHSAVMDMVRDGIVAAVLKGAVSKLEVTMTKPNGFDVDILITIKRIPKKASSEEKKYS